MTESFQELHLKYWVQIFISNHGFCAEPVVAAKTKQTTAKNLSVQFVDHIAQEAPNNQRPI